jgi:signal recognition particle receptor subunit beta
MVFFNYSTMQMAAKVVYYGPGLCGKTTNLHYIYGHTTSDSRGEMVSLETETDRTLFFDLLPLDVGSIAGFNTRIQLYTVPGQVFYNTTRKLVLKGVDGVVFVADSQRAMLQANMDSFRNLEENLTEMGLSVDTLPLVLQYNKRDLSDIYSVDELNQALNRQGWPFFEASAVAGQGVFETLKGISKHTLLALKKRLGRSGAESPTRLSPAGPGMSAAVPRPPAPPTQPAPSISAVQSVPPPFPPGPSPAPPPQASFGPSAPAAEAFDRPVAPTPHGASAPAPASPFSPPSSLSPAAASFGHAESGAAPGQGRPAVAPSGAPGSPAFAAPGGPVAERRGVTSGTSVTGTGAMRTATGKSRSVDVLSELEKLRREAMQPAAHTSQSAANSAASSSGIAAARAAAASNGRSELSRSIEMTLKRSDFARARRFLVSFQVEDDEHRVVDAVRDLQVEIKDSGDPKIEKLLLRLNIALHAKE